MCTAATYQTRDFYFGRTLDYEFSYGDEVTITPRGYTFAFRHAGRLASHYAIIGIATVANGSPLYYEATNEAGLSIAGLYFPGNAYYPPETPEKDNIAPFEIIPWILGQCASVEQARAMLSRMNPVNLSFSPDFPVTPMHWIVSVKTASLTVEPLEQGLRVYENPVGVLTNNPPFDIQLFSLHQYRALSPRTPENNFTDRLPLAPYCNGMGTIGLPGDFTSQARFVRAAFTKFHIKAESDEQSSVSQFFRILGAVQVPRGCVQTADGRDHYTIYTSCCNTDKGLYYYTTYENPQIIGVDMHAENLDGQTPVRYPLRQPWQISMRNHSTV